MIVMEVLFWIVFSGFFSGVETGFYSLNRLRLEIERRKLGSPSPHALRIQELMEDKQSLICMSLLGSNLGIHLATAVTTNAFSVLPFGINPEVAATFVLTPFIFVLGEMVPKNIFRNKADTLISRFLGVILFVKTIFSPFIYGLKLLIGISSFFIESDKSKEESHFDRLQLRRALAVGKEEGVLTSYQSNIAKNIMGLREIVVQEVMIRMEHAESLTLPVSPEDVLEKAKRHGFSRFPLYDEKKEKIVGIINFFDLFYTCPENVRTVPIRKPVFIKQQDTIGTVLPILSRKKQPLAIVLGECQEPVGIVTVKDLVERVVGKLSAW